MPVVVSLPVLPEVEPPVDEPPVVPELELPLVAPLPEVGAGAEAGDSVDGLGGVVLGAVVLGGVVAGLGEVVEDLSSFLLQP